MSDPYIGEIRMFAGTYAPVGWLFCNGSTLSVSDNEALYTLIGTTYGGDGVNTFAVPDLRGRVPVHAGTIAGGGTYSTGMAAGLEQVTLSSPQIGQHSHTMAATGSSPVPAPAGALFGIATTGGQSANTYSAATPTVALAGVGVTGGSQAHPNIQPSLGINFIIATEGIYPSFN